MSSCEGQQPPPPTYSLNGSPSPPPSSPNSCSELGYGEYKFRFHDHAGSRSRSPSVVDSGLGTECSVFPQHAPITTPAFPYVPPPPPLPFVLSPYQIGSLGHSHPDALTPGRGARDPAPPRTAQERRRSVSAFPDHQVEVTPRPSMSSSAGRPFSRAHNPNTLNFVSVYRKTHRHARSFSLSPVPSSKSSITGTFVVDPFLRIPGQILTPLLPGEIRKNLVLQAEGGGIDVDVHLAGATEELNSDLVEKVDLHFEVCGRMGNTYPLMVKLHTPSLYRPPLHTKFRSKNGFTSIHLPPSFHGLLTIVVEAGDLNAHIGLSRSIGAHATLLREDSTSRLYFIGVLDDEWDGDQAQVEVESGRVWIQFGGGRERNMNVWRRVRWEVLGL